MANNLLEKFLLPLFYPDTDTEGGISDIKELGERSEREEEDKTEEDKDEEEEDKTEEGEDKEDKKDEELEEEEEPEELEEEEEEESKEEEEKVTYASDIKKVYPDFFKKFPEVRAAIYRDQQYSEVFGSPKDAAVAAERSDTLARIEKDIIEEGNPDKLLKAVAEANKESFEKISYKILPYLQETNKDLYYQVAAVPIKQLLRAAWREGKGKETDLGRAAAFIHKFFFGDYEFDAKTKGELGIIGEEKESPEKKEYKERLAAIEQREYDNFAKAVDSSYISKMGRFIQEGLDKDERLSDYSKSKLVEDILSGIKKQVEKDPRYINQISSLFKQARLGNYSNDFKTRIINTALARAKSLVPALRSKMVAEALGKVEKKSKEEKKEEEKSKGEGRREYFERERRIQQPKKPLTDIEILRSR